MALYCYFIVHAYILLIPQIVEAVMNSKKNIDTKTHVAKKKKGSFIKKWWDKYVKRLNKITNGKPQCCK
jgi:hypothetical protein